MKLDPEPVSCPDCNKILKNKDILKNHWRKVHVSAPCSICGVVVKNMGLHMGERHKPNSEKKFLCSDCKNGFMTKQKLENHRMSVHLKSQPHKCRHGCDNRYNDSSNRNAHERRRHKETFKDIK